MGKPVHRSKSKPAPTIAAGQQGYKEALRRIKNFRQAKRARTHLDLRGLGLITLPPEIGHLMTLTMLSLDGNELSSLPPVIGRLSTLKSLGLGGNRLSSLPPEFAKLTALAELDLGFNH